MGTAVVVPASDRRGVIAASAWANAVGAALIVTDDQGLDSDARRWIAKQAPSSIAFIGSSEVYSDALLNAVEASLPAGSAAAADPAAPAFGLRSGGVHRLDPQGHPTDIVILARLWPALGVRSVVVAGNPTDNGELQDAAELADAAGSRLMPLVFASSQGEPTPLLEEALDHFTLSAAFVDNEVTQATEDVVQERIAAPVELSGEVADLRDETYENLRAALTPIATATRDDDTLRSSGVFPVIIEGYKLDDGGCASGGQRILDPNEATLVYRLAVAVNTECQTLYDEFVIDVDNPDPLIDMVAAATGADGGASQVQETQDGGPTAETTIASSGLPGRSDRFRLTGSSYRVSGYQNPARASGSTNYKAVTHTFVREPAVIACQVFNLPENCLLDPTNQVWAGIFFAPTGGCARGFSYFGKAAWLNQHYVGPAYLTDWNNDIFVTDRSFACGESWAKVHAKFTNTHFGFERLCAANPQRPTTHHWPTMAFGRPDGWARFSWNTSDEGKCSSFLSPDQLYMVVSTPSSVGTEAAVSSQLDCEAEDGSASLSSIVGTRAKSSTEANATDEAAADCGRLAIVSSTKAGGEFCCACATGPMLIATPISTQQSNTVRSVFPIGYSVSFTSQEGKAPAWGTVSYGGRR